MISSRSLSLGWTAPAPAVAKSFFQCATVLDQRHDVTFCVPKPRVWRNARKYSHRAKREARKIDVLPIYENVGIIGLGIGMKDFLAELKRRNVYKVAVAYVVAGWALSQGIAQVLPVFDVPNWIIRFIVLLVIIGLPIALVLAWMFELTPHGIKRTADADLAEERSRSRAWVYIVVIGAKNHLQVRSIQM
jgi:hypothetical protein